MVTLKQYMQILEIQETFKDDLNRINQEIMKIFNLTKLTKIEADKKILEISNYLNTPQPELIKTFVLDGVEYGFIPNLDNITVGEWIDIDTYQSRTDSLHKLMAIFYRPVVNKLNNSYSIEEYNGTEKLEKIMLESDVKIFNSVMVFFYTLNKELSNALDIYILSEMKMRTGKKIPQQKGN